MSEPIRVGWLANAPIHYHAPLYRLVAADPRLDLTVIYLSNGINPRGGGYAKPVVWDVDLLSGYRNESAKRAPQNALVNRLTAHFQFDRDVVFDVRRGRFDLL